MLAGITRVARGSVGPRPSTATRPISGV